MLYICNELNVEPLNCGIMEIRKVIRGIFLCGVLMLWTRGIAQNVQYLNEVMTQDEAELEGWEETYELLCELEQHPLDINSAT